MHSQTNPVLANAVVRPRGERSFYARDPFGNPICFVERGTEFTGGRFVL